MEITVARSLRLWWIFVIRGLLFAIIGIYLFAKPVSGFAALGFSFGLIVFLTGVSELLRAYQGRGEGNRGWHLFSGVLDIILGLILMSHLVASILILRILIGFYFLFKGGNRTNISQTYPQPVVACIWGLNYITFCGHDMV